MLGQREPAPSHHAGRVVRVDTRTREMARQEVFCVARMYLSRQPDRREMALKI